MGYTTEFRGEFKLNVPLELDHLIELKSFVDERHESEDYPSIWCDWVPSEDGSSIAWNGAEKFYNYLEWLEYIITHFLERWDYVLNGEVEWCGEDHWNDRGTIHVENNVVTVTKTE